MKLDEFAFLNQQLAGMLRAGIPLEGSLRELSRTMRRGKLRGELELLQKDLTDGMPLAQAVERRNLPQLYVRLTQAGVAGGDLPSVLILLADYYSRLGGIMNRLKGLMVYPLIVLVAAFGVSILITVLYQSLILGIFEADLIAAAPQLLRYPGLWLPSLVLGGAILVWTLVMATPRLRHWARWKLPGFREASMAQIAGAASLLLRTGATVQGALALLQKTENNSPAGREMTRWLDLHRQGEAKWTHFTADSRVFPPLFIWLVAQGGEDLAMGFQRAADIYNARSAQKIDILLYSALPISVLLVAGVIVGQMYPVMKAIGNVFSMLGL